MGLYKQGKSKQWWMSFSVNGRQVRESTGTTNKRLAGEVLAKRKTEVFEGRYFPIKYKQRLTFVELYQMWLQAAADKKSLQDDQRRFQAILEYFGRETQVVGLEASEIEDFKDQLKFQVTRLGRPMAPATINRHLSLLKSSLNLAAKRGFLSINPMLTVKLLPERNIRDRICNESEYKQLLARANHELKVAIALGYWTGMRLGEIAGLRWDQVHVKSHVLKLRASDTKNGEPRIIPLTEELGGLLEDLPRQLSGKVFSKSRDKFSAEFRILAKELNIKNLRFHDFRHTAATNLRRAGVDILTIKQITGHKTLKMLERYNRFDEDDLKQAIERMKKYGS